MLAEFREFFLICGIQGAHLGQNVVLGRLHFKKQSSIGLLRFLLVFKFDKTSRMRTDKSVLSDRLGGAYPGSVPADLGSGWLG